MAEWILAREAHAAVGETVACPAHPVLSPPASSRAAPPGRQRHGRRRGRSAARRAPAPALAAHRARAASSASSATRRRPSGAPSSPRSRARSTRWCAWARATWSTSLLVVARRVADPAELVDAGRGLDGPRPGARPRALRALRRRRRRRRRRRAAGLRRADARHRPRRLGAHRGAAHGARASLRCASACSRRPSALRELALQQRRGARGRRRRSRARSRRVAHMAIGARGRLRSRSGAAVPPRGRRARPLTVAVTRVLSGAEAALEEHVVATALEELLASVPQADRAAWSRRRSGALAGLPVEGSKPPSRASLRVAEALPAWLPARRTLGGFYVLRALGAGGVGSVFVVTRVEEQGDAARRELALKVPEYSASAARVALRGGVPQDVPRGGERAHRASAAPEPGALRHVRRGQQAQAHPGDGAGRGGRRSSACSRRGGLDTRARSRVLDDVLARARGDARAWAWRTSTSSRRTSSCAAGEQAVLVDFGLAGRHLRPGCATGPYGAPEVWGRARRAWASRRRRKADVYAFGCVAFETLTGRVLFDADNEMAQIALHLAHDGLPPRLKALARDPRADAAGGAALLDARGAIRPSDRTRRRGCARSCARSRRRSRGCRGPSATRLSDAARRVRRATPIRRRRLRGVRPLLPPRAEHGPPARAPTKRACWPSPTARPSSAA